MTNTPSSARASSAQKKANQYDDPAFNYADYWQGRDYEHAAEEMAIRRLLKGMHFNTAVDIGGGYGRLCVLLEHYADAVTLAEPSQQQLDLAKTFLKDHPAVTQKLMQVQDLQFPDNAVDLVTMVRVMHHLPEPGAGLAEIQRVLRPGGYAIVEVANYSHFRNRLKYLLRGERLPHKPVDIRSAAHRTEDEIPFVNHNPHTVVRQLEHAGLTIVRTLSVSNLRSPGLKKLMNRGSMLAIENVLQAPLAASYFGPSIFFLARKKQLT